MNVSRSNKYNIRIDLDKSHDSYLYDKNSDRELLDFLGMFASHPLGYNHPIFKTDEFVDEVLTVAHTKITNCFIGSDESIEFDKAFTKFAPDCFSNFYYCCTGSLAVEAALKTAIEHFIDKAPNVKPKVITFSESFHGINGWGSFATSRDGEVGKRLDGWPSAYIWEADGLGEGCFHMEVEWLLRRGDVAAVLVEPIRSTYGDKPFYEGFFEKVRAACDEWDVPLIFDEVQTGMGITGTKWYYEQLGVEPDILIFGKKAQISGIMVKDKYSKIFKQPYKKLEATWDATVLDMIRCKYILKAYSEYSILDNVNDVGPYLLEGLKGIDSLKDVRGVGLMLAFDFDTKVDREFFLGKVLGEGLLVNTAGDTTVRLRPNLNLTRDEADEALAIIKRCV